MRSSKVIKVAGQKVRVHRGAKGCYFVDPEEAFYHKHGLYWTEALVKITGDPNVICHLNESGNYAKLPLYSKEFREFLDTPADPN